MAGLRRTIIIPDSDPLWLRVERLITTAVYACIFTLPIVVGLWKGLDEVFEVGAPHVQEFMVNPQ